MFFHPRCYHSVHARMRLMTKYMLPSSLRLQRAQRQHSLLDLLVNACYYIPPLHGEVGMTSRLVLCLGDLFIPDRAPVSSILHATEVCDTDKEFQGHTRQGRQTSKSYNLATAQVLISHSSKNFLLQAKSVRFFALETLRTKKRSISCAPSHLTSKSSKATTTSKRQTSHSPESSPMGHCA